MKKRTTPPSRNPEDTTLTFQLPRKLRKSIEDRAKKEGHCPGPWLRHFVSQHFEEQETK